MHVRLDRKATSISLFVVLGVRRNGQKVLLAVRNMGGESEAAWRALLDDLIDRGPKTPEFLIIGPNTASARLGPARPRAIGWNGVGVSLVLSHDRQGTYWRPYWQEVNRTSPLRKHA